MSTRLEQALRENLTIVRDYGNEWDALCPVHDDSRPSCRVNLNKGVWYCHTCGEGGRLTRLIKEITGESLRGPREVVDLDELEQQLITDVVKIDRVYSPGWMKQFKPDSVYDVWLRERGIKAPWVDKFDLGYDVVQQALTIPVKRPDGAILGVQRRFLTTEKIKYKHPTGVKITDLVFGADQVRARGAKYLWICEGAISTISGQIMSSNSAFDDDVAVGMWSANISDAQYDILRSLYPTAIVFAFDNDKAGRKELEKAMKRSWWCRTYFVDWGVAQANERDDLDDLRLAHAGLSTDALREKGIIRDTQYL